MTYTTLLEEILKRANCVKAEFGSEYLCASHIAVAVTEFCRTKYTGFSVSDMTYWPCRFEEERLRYLFAKVTRVAAYFRIRLSQNTKNAVEEEAFDISCCEHIAALRGAETLPSDIVFLRALTRLHESYRRVAPAVSSDEAVMALLEDADKNVYDYVIENIESVCAALQEKAAQAAAIRDWKPAAKFVEPEALVQLALQGIETKRAGNALRLKIPKFFGNAGLTLSVHCVDGVYYVHDNRCALRYLSGTIRDTKKYAQAVKRVCHSYRIDSGRITGSFVDVRGFMYYLKDLVYVAQAALYYTRAKKQLCFRDKGYVYIPQDKAQPFAEADLMDVLQKCVNAYYEENLGLCCWLNVGNSPFQTRYSFLVETLEDGRIRFSDRLKGNDEGELLEPYYWYYEGTDISVYGKFLSRLAERFGGEFDGKNFFLTEKSKNFQSGLFRFFQLAVLISRLGHDIALPKINKK